MSSSTEVTGTRPKRRLVTVRRVDKITPIKGSNHNVVTVGGWNVVTKRSQSFNENEPVVFFEIDSFLPDTTAFWEYVISRPTSLPGGPRGFLVKTTIIERHLSQGLVFPIGSFQQIVAARNRLEAKYGGNMDSAVEELMTMSFEDVLGVRKWEFPEITDDSLITGQGPLPKPVFVPRPGSERAQNIPGLFRDYGAHRFQITEKLDGFSMSVYLVQESSQWYSGISHFPAGHTRPVGSAHIGICSLSKSASATESSTSRFWVTAERQGILQKIHQVGTNIAVQGELCGSSILGNTMGFHEGEHRFYVFDIFDIDKQKYLPCSETRRICRNLGWDHAPVLAEDVRLSVVAKNLADLINKTNGVGMFGRKREGVVFKGLDHQHFSFKVISNEWLIATGRN
ncbi:RNA ligase-domain-containing protein [Camillea tinctor]|nr:RNA ligase-domain-containing protein [Camillea tinctor]